MTAISYINRIGGVQLPKFNKLARQIWRWCEKRKIWLFASYVPSRFNVEADIASRVKNIDTEWELADFALEEIINEFGSFDIDLFASRINKKCNRFCSWHQDPESFKVDAFTIPWGKWKFYAFPPFALMLRTLSVISFRRSAQTET